MLFGLTATFLWKEKKVTESYPAKVIRLGGFPIPICGSVVNLIIELVFFFLVVLNGIFELPVSIPVLCLCYSSRWEISSQVEVAEGIGFVSTPSVSNCIRGQGAIEIIPFIMKNYTFVFLCRFCFWSIFCIMLGSVWINKARRKLKCF